jgi:hypothetical protein
MSKKAIRNMGIFIFLVIISGWIGVLVDSLLTDQPEGDSLGMGIWLVLPLLTAFIIILFSKASWRDLGLKPNFRALVIMGDYIYGFFILYFQNFVHQFSIFISHNLPPTNHSITFAVYSFSRYKLLLASFQYFHLITHFNPAG